MPLMRPDIQKVLRQSGLTKEQNESSLAEKLNEAGLGIENTLENLAELSRSGNESLRLRANEMTLKLHGVLKDAAPTPPSVTIIIKDPTAPEGVNPILLPRQMKEQIQ